MRHHRTVWAPFGAGFFSLFLLVPGTVSAQQSSQATWQGPSPPSSLQSPTSHNSSQAPASHTVQPTPPTPSQPPLTRREQTLPHTGQAITPGLQGPEKPSAQEVPTVWPPKQAAIHNPGYLGLSGQTFHRSRFCMHAMTIHGVEVTAVVPNSPAARAGLRTARALSTREAAVATVAGLLALTPAAPLAAPVVRAAGGVGHGDIILAVGGKRVKTRAGFEHALARFGPHSIVYLTVRRKQAVVQIPVRLDEWPHPEHRPAVQHVRAEMSEMR